jgi:hypothetical protein
VGTLLRGRVVTVRNAQPGWDEVVLPDGAEGWVPHDRLLAVKAVEEATVTEPTPVFSAPRTDGPPATTLDPGHLLLILARQGKVTQVHVEDFGVAYVASEQLVEDPQELKMSHMLVVSKHAAANNDVDETLDLFDEARIKYPTSPLLDSLANYVSYTRMRTVPHRATHLKD